MKLEITCDDGSIHDFKLIKILKKFNLPCTFYIAPANTDLSPEQIRRISRDYEIGGHTLTHTILTRVPEEVARDEIKVGKRMLEDIIGRKVTKFCYPRGRYNPRIKQLVEDAGFEEARTTRLLCTEEPDDPFEKHTTIHAFQNPKYDMHWVEVTNKILDNKPEYFHIWLHSWEVERDNQWGNLIQVLKRITNENSHT